MKNYKKYAKTAMVLVCALFMTFVMEGAGIRQLPPLSAKATSDSSVKAAAVQRELNPKEKPTENATVKKKATVKKSTKIVKEKATEKVTQKATEKPTEKATHKASKKSKAKATEAPTEMVTEEVTQQPTEPTSVLNVVVEDATQEEHIIPTEPPTEWSQQLQDVYDAQYAAGYLFAIDNPDYSYQTGQVTLSEKDRVLACQIVYGEAGGEDFECCCMVAQCIKDSMVFLGYNSVADVQKYCKYDGWQKNYSATAEQAVDYIFNQNRSAVAHRILFFYAPNICTSKWHESQNYIMTYANVRFFDM